ncbi:hypothetical protein ABPG77_005468 [Micractinium sp. CCAP 211/92]
MLTCWRIQLAPKLPVTAVQSPVLTHTRRIRQLLLARHGFVAKGGGFGCSHPFSSATQRPAAFGGDQEIAPEVPLDQAQAAGEPGAGEVEPQAAKSGERVKVFLKFLWKLVPRRAAGEPGAAKAKSQAPLTVVRLKGVFALVWTVALAGALVLTYKKLDWLFIDGPRLSSSMWQTLFKKKLTFFFTEYYYPALGCSPQIAASYAAAAALEIATGVFRKEVAAVVFTFLSAVSAITSKIWTSFFTALCAFLISKHSQ